MAALCGRFLARITASNNLYSSCKCISTGGAQLKKHHVEPVMRELFRRRLEAGPEPERHRSVWSNWNYDAEVFSFGKRLGEEFNDHTLKRALTYRSYVDKEEQKRNELGIEESTLNIPDNLELVKKGAEFMSSYIKLYLRFEFPRLPEQGIIGVHDHLMSDIVLAHVSSHIGTTDLILCDEFPVEEKTLSTTLQSVVGALLEDRGEERAGHFVQDFVIAQLLGEDVNSMFDIPNPMGILADILKRHGHGEPEPRLLRHTGSNTLLAVYLVGIYSDKILLGQAPGETVTIAEEEAARDALRNVFDVQDWRSQINLGEKGHRLELRVTSDKNRDLRNYSLTEEQLTELS